MSNALNEIKPPVIELGVIGLLKKNLFSTWYNTLLTILGFYLLYSILPPLFNWIFFDANFVGNSKEDCSGKGACWVFVKVWLNRFVYGMYPDTEQWRINSAFIMLFLLST